ncbi:magnesium transporter [Gordonia sp. (in: high G+C Gram-positive bacteria)]|uniref:magnesium transporter n=1 Tax=Gordonia sp. (in: high G+C Gram-positive bacteria) TaxID=84139 RepID=UPI0016A25A47|nr:magnesium transporter [Gordonia sp. (in: high G+C Gram-positive bacteria)]NLG46161.1 magnesium transporter [Gordonia sp. (in: high G+C Gram-positive bacteria)]
MTALQTRELDQALAENRLAEASSILSDLAAQDVAAMLELLNPQRRSIAFRLLAKDQAVKVFDDLASTPQAELIEALGTAEVAEAFDHLEPDDRAELLDELPATVAKALIRNLSREQRDATAVVLGFPRGSVGRRMSPEFVHAFDDDTVEATLTRVKARGHQASTIYTVPVVDHARRLLGVVSLRDLLLNDPDRRVGELAKKPIFARVDADAEPTAQRCVDRGILAMPVVDAEQRLIGVLTLDDAIEVVDAARDEDEARAGAREPLKSPYLQASILAITKARVVWLFVLAVSAILTVNVLEIFEGTLEQKVALALFIPLLTGIGGNTGSQAATTVTRALATDEVGPRDVGKVLGKEVRVGLTLGAALGLAGFLVAWGVYEFDIGAVIGLTIVSVCTMAASVGGLMPLIARMVRVDPAVFSTPFISTFCDATGLIIYFSIAKAVLGI